MADISQIVLLDESVYDLKDAVARGLLNGHSVGIDVPSNAKFTDTTYTAASANPLMDGSVAVGTSAKYAREDHRHPVDTSRAPASHTHTADSITGAGYLNIHPENNPTLIPFINNDIAFLLRRGGSAVVTYDGVVKSVDISGVFDGSGTYWAMNPTGITTIVIELTFHKTFSYSTWIYADFGAVAWRAKNIKVEVMNSTSEYPNDTWIQKYSTTTNTLGHIAFVTSHTPVGAANAGGGFNKVRFTFSDWGTSTIFRIAQLGIYNYSSYGLRETYMSRGSSGDYVFRDITPNNTDTYSLGSATNKWKNIYATTFTGSFEGSASKVNNHTVNSDVPANAVFTDTKNTAGSTDTSSKIFLIGATSQAANPQTYSHDTAYVGTDGCLYSGGTKVLTSHQSLSGKLDTSLKGAANGLAELDANGKVPTAQLPSYVDDVLEYTAKSSFPTTGETGKIYVDTGTNKTYRWSGSAYVEISASLALGATSSTAFRGDYGNSAYAHAVTNKGSAFSSGLYKITTNSEGHVTAATAVAKADITGLGIPGTDTNTHRPIQVNGTEVLGNNTTALNLKAGSNVSVTNSSGTVTIAATDTTYSSKAAASGGTDVSLVTTGEKYTWNSKTSNTGTVTKVSTGVGLTGGDITGTGTIKAKLKSETASTLDSAAMGSTASRQYAVGVDKSGYLSVNIPWTDTNTQYTANTSKLVTTTVPNVTSVGKAATLGTAIPADDITAWTTNTPTSFSVSGEKLVITSGKAASLSYTAKSIPNVTSAGTVPTLGTAITVATGSLSSSGGGGTVATGITAS